MESILFLLMVVAVVVFLLLFFYFIPVGLLQYANRRNVRLPVVILWLFRGCAP